MSSTSNIRKILHAEQQRIISTIWTYFVQNAEWIPARALHKEFGGKTPTRALIDELGGSIVYIPDGPSLQRYILTTLGVLLSDEGERYEALFADYLSFVYEKCYDESSRITIKSEEVAEALHLKTDEITLLGYLLLNEPRFANGGSSGAGQWEVGIPLTIEDIPSDKLEYIRHIFGSDYDPQMPVEALKKFSYLHSKHNKEQLNRSISPVRTQPASVERGNMPTEGHSAEIFISYSRADSEFIHRLEPMLRRKYRDDFWYDAEIVGGDVWWEETILPAIAACTVFVYMLSNDAISSEYCRKEMAEAQRLSKWVLPVIIRPKTEIPEDMKSALNRIQFVDMQEGINEKTITELFTGIEKLLDKNNQPQPYIHAPKEALELRKSELAIRVGILSARLRDQFEGALSPMTFAGESADREKAPNESPQDTSRLDEGYARRKRLIPAAKTLDELAEASWEAEIIWGKSLEHFIIEYRKALNELVTSMEFFFFRADRGSIGYTGAISEDHIRFEQKLHGTIYDIDGVLRERIRGTTTDLIKSLAPYLNMRWRKDKTGDIYWLGSDITVAISMAVRSDPDTVKHYIRQLYWHVSQLKLDDPIEGRFARLWEKVKSFVPETWNDINQREEISNELSALLHAIAFVMEGEDTDFRGSPPDDWKMGS